MAISLVACSLFDIFSVALQTVKVVSGKPPVCHNAFVESNTFLCNVLLCPTNYNRQVRYKN